MNIDSIMHADIDQFELNFTNHQRDPGIRTRSASNFYERQVKRPATGGQDNHLYCSYADII